MPIRIRLDRMLLQRRMSLSELADRVGVTAANLSILKTGRARAVRWAPAFADPALRVGVGFGGEGIPLPNDASWDGALH